MRLACLTALVVLTAWVLSTDLPRDTSTLFAGSGTCGSCHESDGSALRDSKGTDLSLTTRWRSTIMANAAKDPLWQAKVESEVSAFPALKEVIEDKCTTCHAPMGRTQALFDQAAGYSMEAMRASPLAMDGVSCTVCHQIQPDNLGQAESFSGGYVIDDTRTIFGPYDNVAGMIMQAAVNYKSAFGSHMNSAELCAVCHTLYTPYVDDAGNVAGTFPEQVPYLEWQNSVYAQEEKVCQDCHMPRIEEPVRISTVPPTVEARSPFWQHLFVGGNAFMLTLLRDNGDDIGVTATTAQFDSTVALTRRQLQQRAARLTAEASTANDQLTLEVEVENLAGHKLPTGFPSRRAWLHVLVRNEDGERVFESGGVDAEGRIQNLDAAREPHRDLIDAESQVQVYESRMVDVNGEPTFTLLRGAGYVKDNRIPPKGFVTGAAQYDDMATRGEALNDANFNHDESGEGSGTDRVTYRVDIAGQTDELSVTVELLYQSVTPAFVDALLAYDTPAVARFREYYEQADRTPELMQSVTFEVDLETGTAREASPAVPSDFALLPNYPNPFQAATVIPYTVSTRAEHLTLQIYDLQGRLVRTLVDGDRQPGRYTAVWDGRGDHGILAGSGPYVYRLTVGSRQRTGKLVFLK